MSWFKRNDPIVPTYGDIIRVLDLAQAQSRTISAAQAIMRMQQETINAHTRRIRALEARLATPEPRNTSGWDVVG